MEHIAPLSPPPFIKYQLSTRIENVTSDQLRQARSQLMGKQRIYQSIQCQLMTNLVLRYIRYYSLYQTVVLSGSFKSSDNVHGYVY